jgi:hypothetical protein
MGMDREKWLAIRNTPRKLKNERLVHVSTNMQRFQDPADGGKIKAIKVGKGQTFRKNHGRGD